MTIDLDAVEQIIEEKDFISINELFYDLIDERYQPNISYTLSEVFFLVLCAQLCGFDSFREYEDYGNLKLNFLRRFLPYENGIPVYKTIRSILAVFRPVELEKMFRKAIALIIGKNGVSEDGIYGQDTIAIDGKTHRGCKKTLENDSMLHIVSAYSTKEGLILGQEKVADKSNEITAIPELLDALDIAGQIVTIDAMGCQVEIADKIRSKKADYILSLKGNQGNLYDAVATFFDNPDNANRWTIFEASNKGHGRHETRKCTVGGNLNISEPFKKWTDLESVIKIESTRIIKGKEQHETRYFISSLAPDPRRAASSIRDHWGIENKVHWYLDVVFKEDQRIIWDKNIAQNESIMRRLALCLLKKYKEREEITGKTRKPALKTLRKGLVADDIRMEAVLSCFC